MIKELQAKGMSEQQARDTLKEITSLQETDNLKEIENLFEKLGYPKEALQFDPTLVRGLDYYTGLILEVVLKSNPTSSSLAGGGRWDNMIGQFTGVNQPAVGFAIGLDRTIEAMVEEGVLDTPQTLTKVLVTIFSKQLEELSLKITSRLRSNNIPTEVWLDSNTKLDKQLKYGSQKKIPYVVIIGPNEAEKNTVALKNLSTGEQEILSFEDLTSHLI
ncbi:MAG: Histidyl-tRNA synthetase [Candidatus Daviesbacteria bacterium GW2011_GWA1_38_7]|nr:MAG: Histidyl-tRNA synthetase [Candidatus Daviesbacteria bacterium GW2011_GWA1_38_7]